MVSLLKRVLIGTPIATSEEGHQRLRKRFALHKGFIALDVYYDIGVDVGNGLRNPVTSRFVPGYAHDGFSAVR